MRKTPLPEFPRLLSGPLGRSGGLVVLTVLITAGPAFSAWPVEVPARFAVTGTVALEVEELGEFSGEMWATLIEHPDRTVTMPRLTARIRDFDIVRRRLGDDDRTPFRCNRLINTGPFEGTLLPGHQLSFTPPLTVYGTSWQRRAEGPGCQGEGGLMRLEATVHLDVDGRYDNRPPEARFGVEGEGLPGTATKGACPWAKTMTHRFANRTVTLRYAHANSPDGLELIAQSISADPDGTWARSNIATEQWSRFSYDLETGEESHVFLGRGRRLGPLTFEMDLLHKLQLTVTDHDGAMDRVECEFVVVDGLPPAITVPASTTVPCTVEGGATPGTSSRLRAFLGAASAEDLVDPAPRALEPQVAGVEVGPDTLFPLNEWTAVDFRFEDESENRALQRSRVRVTDTTPPELVLELPRGVLQAEGRSVKVRPRLKVRDDCGQARFHLESVVCNDPELIDTIPGGYVDKPVREIEILAPPRRVASNPDPRIYVVTYVAVDAAGNEKRVSKKLRVAPARGRREP